MTHRSDGRSLPITQQARADAEQRAALAFLGVGGAAPRDHICGACRTPYGRSALPCKNDPNQRKP